jgi:hypothetical protein
MVLNTRLGLHAKLVFQKPELDALKARGCAKVTTGDKRMLEWVESVQGISCHVLGRCRVVGRTRGWQANS